MRNTAQEVVAPMVGESQCHWQRQCFHQAAKIRSNLQHPVLSVSPNAVSGRSEAEAQKPPTLKKPPPGEAGIGGGRKCI
jgi:hypothetical protein